MRCGLNGRRFTFYKFRSMVADAEQRMHEVAHLNRENRHQDPQRSAADAGGQMAAQVLDRRIAAVVNVLRGDMSLVGPRPAMPSEVAQYKRWQRRRLRMRPGLTCLWAVTAGTRWISNRGCGWICSTSTTGRWGWMRGSFS